MKDNLPTVVSEAIKLERENTKADIDLMVVDDVKLFLRDYMNNNILHVHPTTSASLSIPNFQQQLYLKMKDDKQALDADFPLWLTLMYKFERPASHVDPCRIDAFCSRDHEDHHGDDARPEGESNAKRQRTSKKKQQEEIDACNDDQGTDDDEVPSKEVSPKLLAKMTWKGMKWVPTTTDDQKRMQDTLNDMMRSRCDLGEEHQYHLDQMKSYM
nr:hypothetical protein [Tanacetum cinerariifolium]